MKPWGRLFPPAWLLFSWWVSDFLYIVSCYNFVIFFCVIHFLQAIALISVIILFFLRGINVQLFAILPLIQIILSIIAILSLSYILRARILSEKPEGSSCDSLERKRDISRALLDHVADTAKQSDAGSNGSVHSDCYLKLHQNLYDRAPMVSIV